MPEEQARSTAQMSQMKSLMKLGESLDKATKIEITHFLIGGDFNFSVWD